jgi:hypothetical protein
MEKVKTEDAVGKILASDVTEVVLGVKKGPLFKRGHLIVEEDIIKLISIGKHYLWVESDVKNSSVHEDIAAVEMMEGIKGDNISVTSPSESRVKLVAEEDGVVIINKEGLGRLNSLEDVAIAVRRNFTFVKKGQEIGTGKVIPVAIPESEMKEINLIEKECSPIVAINSFKVNRIAIFPVGNEFIEGLREEKISEKVQHYFEELGQEVLLRKVLPDDEEKIAQVGLDAIKLGANFIIFVGGMGVDPDDKTVEGIKKMGAEIVRYGVPIFPGQTFLVSYKDQSVVIGMPSGIGMFGQGTSFHRLMPILLSGYRLLKEEIIEMGEGGFIDA